MKHLADLCRRILDKPWAVVDEFRRLLLLPYIWLVFFCHGLRWGAGCRIYGTPILQRHRGSSIVLGRGVQLRSWRSSNPLSPYHPVVLATRAANAQIVIGDDTGMTGATLVAAESIHIGRDVSIGANTTIVDTDFHHLSYEARLRDPQGALHRPVIIEDGVFIGMNSIILKGVHIGRGSVIGAGSVVVSAIPDGVIAAGNPARVLRNI